MEVEKRGVKGGLFQLFDWHGKSRKKLFSIKAQCPESSNQGKENYIARHRQELEKGFPANVRDKNDYHYASSPISDSEYGTKPAGVVARLMGLDSLPTSKVNDPCFTTPFTEPHAVRDSSAAFQCEYDIVIIESMRNKLDGFSGNPLPYEMRGRHLERFQREVLPPKYARPISVAHNRLLSPIKCPGFVPSRNVAYIIEAAAKMVEQSPRSAAKAQFPSLGSSSFPLRVQELKEKVEAVSRRPCRPAEKGKDQIFMKPKKNIDTRGKSRSQDTKGSSEESKRVIVSQRSKSKEKQGSPALQAKTNVQKRDVSISLVNRRSERKKDPPNMQRNLETRTSSSRRNPDVLRQNFQKQNCAFSIEDESFRSSKERHESNMSSNNYVNGRPNRNVKKIVVRNVVASRKTNFVMVDPGKDISSSREKMNPKRKMTIDGKKEQIQVEKPIKVGVEFEGDSTWDGHVKKDNSSDVVSFTFTSPIKKSGGRASSFGTVLEASGSYFPDCDTCSNETLAFNVGGETLSLLLEQKLKELTSRVEIGSLSNSVNSCGDTSTISSLKPLPLDIDTCKSKREIPFNSGCPSADQQWLKTEKDDKGLPLHLDKDGDNCNIDSQCPVSFSHPPSPSAATSELSDVDRSSTNEGMLSDTASSLSIGFMPQTLDPTSYTTSVDSEDCLDWELHYIRAILNEAELLLDEFALGRVDTIISADLFDQLENRKRYSYKDTERDILERKVLFDCVCERLQARYGGLHARSHKLWVEQMTLLQRRGFLAEELHREILGESNDEEKMVDEIVDKDMSCKEGKWVEFEIQGFEEGMEMEGRILSCLVDELVDDFLF